MQNKFKSIILWSVLVTVDLVLVSGFCELLVRQFIPTMNVCYDVDETIGVIFCPNQETYGYVENEYVNVFRTNSSGFHDHEYPMAKSAETLRIHMYGDSMIQGKGVPIDDSLPKIIERQVLDSGLFPKVEVMNMASGDDSTSCQIVTYEEIGRGYSPDVVICYFDDDFGDNIIEVSGVDYSPYHRIAENGDLEVVPPVLKDTSTPWERFKRSSLLYRLYANKLFESRFYHDLKSINKSVAGLLHSSEADASVLKARSHGETVKALCVSKSWPLTLRLIEHFNYIVKQDNREFILVDGLTFNDNFVGETYTNKDLEAFCMDRNINYLAAYPKHRELNTDKNRRDYFFRDNHPTSLGNEKISAYVAQKLIPHFRKINQLQNH